MLHEDIEISVELTERNAAYITLRNNASGADPWRLPLGDANELAGRLIAAYHRAERAMQS